VAKKTEPGTFAAMLMNARPGTEQELTAAVREVVAAVKETGKGGSISLKLSITPIDGNVNVLSVNDAISKTVPQHDRKGSMVFPTSDNDLVRESPTSMPLFGEPGDEDVKDVPADQATGEVKEISA
jgi:hypothetical protein